MRLHEISGMPTRARVSARALVKSILISFAVAAQATGLTEHLPPQPLMDALDDFAKQTGLQLLYKAGLVEGVHSPGAPAGRSPEDTLSELLKGTGLTYEFVNERTLTIVRTAPAVEKPEPPQEVLVQGWRQFDQRHSHHDLQPYTVIFREQIERSGATNLGGVLQRVTMNAQSNSEGLFGGPLGDRSIVDMRGLGADDTLLLINGRRATTAVVQGQPVQADINGIPLLAVEKIEILPMTASGVYGGSATGGVVNVILRSDYTGLEAELTHHSDFGPANATDSVNVVYGAPLWSERASFMAAFTRSDGDMLTVDDRDLAQRGQAAVRANNPGFFLDSSVPPLGATPNFRTIDGSPLSDSVSEAFGFVPENYAGGGDLDALQAHAGEYNFDLPDSAQQTGLRRSLTTATRGTGAIVGLKGSFAPNIHGYVQGIISRREGKYQSTGASTSSFAISPESPWNPFDKLLFATIPFSAADGVIDSDVRNHWLSGGLSTDLDKNWRFGFDYTWGRFSARHSDPVSLDYDAAAAAIESGELDVLRDLRTFPVDFSPYLFSVTDTPYKSMSRDARLWIEGRLPGLMAQDVELAAMLDRHTEAFRESSQLRSTAFTAMFPAKSQNATSVYIETRWPLTRALKLVAAARHDSYRILGAPAAADPFEPVTSTRKSFDAFNPTVAIHYRFPQSLAVRASYSTGFRPPDATQLVPTINSGLPSGVLGFLGLLDPRRGNTPVIFGAYVDGGNPALRPEQSESWSVGFVLKPRSLEGLELSVDYTRIKKTDDIASFPAGPQGLLDSESEFPHRVERAPRAPDDPEGWAGPIRLLNNTVMNIASAQVEAVDVDLDYQPPETRFGRLELSASLTWQPHLITQALAGYPRVENAGVTIFNPPKLKGFGELIWSHANWTAGPSLRYFGGYVVSTNPLVLLNQGSSRVQDQLYVDAFVSYRFAGMEARLIVQNVLDTRPPVDAGSPLFYSSLGDPRLATYAVTVRKTFWTGAAR